MGYRVNIVEDDQDLNTLLRAYLENEQFEVHSFTTYKEAHDHVNDDVDIWIMDVVLDEHSGFDLLQEIKSNNQDTPVILMSARDQEFDRVIGLEKGSDDYVTKPFSPKEVVLRANNILKRKVSTFTDQMDYSIYHIDLRKRRVYCDDEEIELTTKEFELLMYFVQNKTIAFSREEIAEAVWDNDSVASLRVIDDTIRRLRKKMPSIKIRTIYGYGYRLD